MRTWKRFMTVVLSATMTAGMMTVPTYADTASGKVTVEGDTREYDSLAEAIQEHADDTGEVVMTLEGNVTWETGARHGSTPFEMVADTLILAGVDGASFTATGKGVGPIGIGTEDESKRDEYDGKVIFQDLEIIDQSESYAENSWEFGYLEFRGNLEFVNCNFKNAIQIDGDNGHNKENTLVSFSGCTFNSNKESEYDVWIGEGTASFENCVFQGYRGLKVHEAYGSVVDSVTLTGCTFDSLSKKPGIAVGDVDADTSIMVENCKVIDCQAGDQGKFLYESDTDITAFENNFVEETAFELIFTPTKLIASPSNATMEVGAVKEAEAEVNFDVADAYAVSEIEWTSSNEEVVAVTPDAEDDSKATLEAVNVGAAIVTASYTDNEKTVTDTIQVVVGGDFKVTASQERLKLGQQVKFTAYAVASASNASYEWDVQGGLALDADEGKTMTATAVAVGGGSASVDFSEGEVSGTGAAAVVIEAPELKVTVPASVTLGKEFRITTKVTNVKGEAEDLGVEIAVDASNLEELDNGKYVAAEVGTETIIVTMTYPTSDGSEGYVEIEKEIQVTRPAADSSSYDDDDDDDDDDSDVISRKNESGKWVQNEKGWWYRYKNGTWPAARWVELDWMGVKSWYYFNEEGYMVTGWHQDGDYRYYLHPVSDGTQGHMYTGWHQIENQWYYFNPVVGGPKGALLVNTTTPDGYRVDANGVRIQ